MSIEDLLKNIPPICFKRLTGSADFYGASHIIAQALGRSHRRSFADWVHGWTPYPCPHVRQLSGPAPKHRRILTWSKWQEGYLRENGYLDAHAVGSPSLHLLPQKVTRLPGSLLVMPFHSLPYSLMEWNEDSYLNAILSLRSHFSHIILCVHSSCMEQGNWINTFKDKGIHIVRGSDLHDIHSLLRMRYLLSSVEYMTSNGLGTHIAYGCYYGAKVSLYGDYAETTADAYRKDPFYLNYPEALAPQLERLGEARIREQFPFLFCQPREAAQQIEKGREWLGEADKKEPEEIACLLGWELRDQLKGYPRWLIDELPRKLYHSCRAKCYT